MLGGPNDSFCPNGKVALAVVKGVPADWADLELLGCTVDGCLRIRE